jgi:hypothetical protein
MRLARTHNVLPTSNHPSLFPHSSAEHDVGGTKAEVFTHAARLRSDNWAPFYGAHGMRSPVALTTVP